MVTAGGRLERGHVGDASGQERKGTGGEDCPRASGEIGRVHAQREHTEFTHNT